jgi:PTS system cellobiose-specific IIB component
VSASEVDDNIEQKNVDVLLLGPQVRFMEKQFKDKLEPKGIPVAIIDMKDYGMMNGKNVLEQADQLIAAKK